MTKDEQGKELVAQLEFILREWESIPALKDSIQKEREGSEMIMRQVVAAYGQLENRVNRFVERIKDATPAVEKYLKEYHAKDTLH